jgi:Family of unknown function (DUF5906)
VGVDVNAAFARAQAMPNGPERDAVLEEAREEMERQAAERAEATKEVHRNAKRKQAKTKPSEPLPKTKKVTGQDATQDALDKLNERFFIVDVGSETVVGEEVEHLDNRTGRRWSSFTFRTFADFSKKLVKHNVDVRVVKRGVEMIEPAPLAKVWLGWKSGRQYEQLVYAPPGAAPAKKGDLNGWRGFTTEPKPGDWARTREFLLDVICDGDTALSEWLLNWCAALFQQPGLHGECALILLGPEGIGKNFFAETLLAFTFDGRHAHVTSHTNQVLGEFNSVLSGVCLLVLDEVTLASKAEAGHARSIVTGHVIPINRKGLDAVEEQSMLHTVILTNEENRPLYMAGDDRRYGVFRVSSKRKNDVAYYRQLAEALRQGERAAFLDEMLTREVDWDALRRAPHTAAKDKVKRASWAPVFHFLVRTMRGLGREAWNEGRGIVDISERSNEVKDQVNKHVDGQRWCKEEMGQAFGLFLQDQRLTDIDPQLTLHEAFRKMFSDAAAKKTWNRVARGADGKPSRRSWTLPAWDEMQAALARALGVEPEALGLDEEV